MLEKAKPTSVDSYSDKPKALIRNVGSQPLGLCVPNIRLILPKTRYKSDLVTTKL